MVVTIINDCTDVNAKGRQHARVASLFHCTVHHIDICDDLTSTGSIQAGANLIDVIDALENEGVILVNTAPRNGEGKRWPNGTPFCYFWVNHTLVVSSISGYTLSYIKKFQLVNAVNILDVPTVLKSAINQGLLEAALFNHIVDSQFRSFEWLCCTNKP